MKTLLTTLTLTTTLLITSCSPNPTNPTPSSPTPTIDIHTAALQGNLGAIQQHIASGTDLNAKDPTGGSTPLIIASTFGHPEIVKALVEAQADLNATNNDGSTALASAAFLCQTEIVQTLLAHGANKSIRNNMGSTALDSVTIPFNQAQPIYELLQSLLGPLGLKIDLNHVQQTRPQIANLLK